MIDFEHLSPDTVLLAPDGMLSTTDLNVIDGVLGDTLGPDAEARVNILLDLCGLSDITASVGARDRTAEALLGAYLGRIGRLGVISDKEWVTVLLRAAGAALPGSDMRAFGSDARDMARNFVLGQLPRTESDAGPALRLLDSGHPDLLAYEIDGVLTQEDAERVLEVFEHALERDRPVSLLVKISRYGGFDPAMLLSGPLWTMKLARVGNLKRYAIVGADPWMQSVAQFANPLSPVNMKLFSHEGESAAWDWVRDGLRALR